MEEKRVNYGAIVLLIVVVVLFIPIIVNYVKEQKIVELKVDEVREKMALKESFVLYVGDVDKKIKKDLKQIKNIKTNEYSLPYAIYSVSNDSKLKNLFDKEAKVVLIINGDIQKEYNDYKYETIYSDVERLVVGNITSKNASYKVVENFKAYKSLVKSKDVNVMIFGRASCYHCNNYKLVYNAVADKYNLDIYYFDSDSYNAEQYKKIVNMDLTVPAKCSSQGEEFKLSDGFGTPLTILTKKGKIVDCISGYVERARFINVLKANKLISEW